MLEPWNWDSIDYTDRFLGRVFGSQLCLFTRVPDTMTRLSPTFPFRADGRRTDDLAVRVKSSSTCAGVFSTQQPSHVSYHIKTGPVYHAPLPLESDQDQEKDGIMLQILPEADRPNMNCDHGLTNIAAVSCSTPSQLV
jgi:hypothetical protein